MLSYLIPLVLTLAACFGIQTLALRSVGGRTNKSESNFFSSVARIQTGVRGQPRVMLLGSSMTGRLPDRSYGFEGVANMGCDGSSAVDTLRAMDRGLLPVAPVLIIEGNTFYHALTVTSSEISRTIGSPWFKLGVAVPNLGATARPAAFFYSRLLARKIGGPTGVEGALLPVEACAVCVRQVTTLPPHAEALMHELAGILGRLQAKGTRCLLVILPPGAAPGGLNSGIPRELSRVSGIPLLDLAKDLPQGAVTYTDHVHMTPPSATAALRTILRALETPAVQADQMEQK